MSINGKSIVITGGNGGIGIGIARNFLRQGAQVSAHAFATCFYFSTKNLLIE